MGKVEKERNVQGEIHKLVFRIWKQIRSLKKIMEAAYEGATERIVNSKDLQQQSKAFDELSDSVEDRLLDSSRVQEAMASIAASAEADGNVMRMREIIGCC
ncbi:uncharacterized protein LOC110612410 [Manihot esculenta]|uniref:Uncharacterized protein n=1 Tax=Manihot esculenta TaxID=3983 RepID=A0A2C9W983_MANES|nr:uncharacterized protein LOC110612410 [Manihot esculenta]